jgi:hypothetical protein
MGDKQFLAKFQPPPHSRKHVKYRKFQSKIYNFLERPSSRGEVSYHVLVFCLVFLCLALSVFSTIEGHEEEAGLLLFYLEILTVTWFGVEFALRLWSAGCRSRFQAVLRIRIRIHMFLGLPDPDPSVRIMDPDLDPSITKQKK